MTVNLSSTELSEIICTRLSHDLIGNIGAVANAVEILDDGDSVQEVRPILDVSARTLTARLKFFRMTFGLDNACPKNIEEMQKIIADYLTTVGSRTAPVNLCFHIMTPQLYKLVLSAIMTLADVFIRGGELIAEEKNGLCFTARSASPLSAAKLAVIENILNGKMPEDNPAQSAPILYLLNFLKNKNVKISLQYTENQAVMTIS